MLWWKAYHAFMTLYYLLVHIYIVLYARAPVAAASDPVGSDTDDLRSIIRVMAMTVANVVIHVPALYKIIKKPESTSKAESSKRSIVKMLALTFAFYACGAATAVYSMRADGHSADIPIYVLYPFYACWALAYPAYGFVLLSKKPKSSDKSA